MPKNVGKAQDFFFFWQTAGLQKATIESEICGTKVVCVRVRVCISEYERVFCYSVQNDSTRKIDAKMNGNKQSSTPQ